MPYIFVDLAVIFDFHVKSLFPVRTDSKVTSDDVAPLNREVRDILSSELDSLDHYQEAEYIPWRGDDWLFGLVNPDGIKHAAKNWNTGIQARTTTLAHQFDGKSATREKCLELADVLYSMANTVHERSDFIVILQGPYDGPEVSTLMPDYIPEDVTVHPERYAMLRCKGRVRPS